MSVRPYHISVFTNNYSNSFLYFCIGLLLFIFVQLSMSADPDIISEPNCEDLLIKYAEQTSNFTKCFIQHARPIRVCQFCISNFIAVKESLNNITHLDKVGEKCKAELINMDKLQVIAYSFKYVAEQWCKASCEKCFEKGKKVLNLHSQILRNYSNKLENCIINANKSHSTDKKIICKQCEKKYSELNTHYEEYGAASNFCMDIIDMMNITRQRWSVELGCSSQCDKPTLLLVIISFILLILSVMFYVATWYYTSTTNPPLTFQERWTRRYEVLQSSSSQ